MASGETTVKIRIDNCAEAVLAFLKLGAPRQYEDGACAYCHAALGSDAEGFVASMHRLDCAWVRLASATVGNLTVV